jgi:putative transposase
MDLYRREIIGFSISKSPNAELAKLALNNAIKTQRPDASKLMFHLIKAVNIQLNILENYSVLIKSLKVCVDMETVGIMLLKKGFLERLNYKVRKDHDDAIGQINKYITFYNYTRSHSSIGYMAPHQKAVVNSYNVLKNMA